MAEREQNHRHGIEILEVQQPFILAKRGQALGITALFLIAALAAYLAYLGHAGWAAAVGSIDIAAIVTVFVTGKLTRDEASNEERELDTNHPDPKGELEGSPDVGDSDTNR